MTINNILGQPVATFDPELAAIQASTLDALEQINHSKRDPNRVMALQELGRRLVEAVTDVDREYNLAQYLTDLQLVVNGPGRFNLFLNEVDKRAKTKPIVIGKEQRSIQLETYHGKQESRESGAGPRSGQAGSGETGSGDSAPVAPGGTGPVAGIDEGLPIASE